MRFSALCCRPCRAVSPLWSLCAPPALCLFLPCGTCALPCAVLSPLPCCFSLVEFVRSPCTVLSPLPCCFSLVELVRSPALCLVRTAFAMRGYLERRSPLFGALKALKTLRVLKNHRFSNTPNISNTSNTPKIHPLAARMIDFTDISLSSFSFL